MDMPMTFAPEYVSLVLNENFEDAKTLFLDPLMALHDAHLVMLVERGIVSRGDGRLIRGALDAISLDEVRRTVFDGTDEDLFCHVNRLLVAACGDEVAGRLHTARSRNDIDMVLYRMRQRDLVLGLLDATLQLRDALIEVAGRNRDTIFPAHTHTQPAQPSTIAHYLLAVIEQLERDATRLRAAYETTNRCPLGACAITGTGFDIDRQLTSDLLGFLEPTGNTYGSIATVDYLLQNVSAALVTLAGFGRFAQDLLQWCTVEFGYLRLADGFVQPSSIMPQKRNPVSVEHARSIASRALGEAMAVMVAVHNTPFGDIVDTEDDLQPVVFSAFWDATRAIGLLAAAFRGAEFDRAKLEARAGQGGITLTELADVLARDHGVPFQVAHRIVAALIQASQAAPDRALAEILAEVSAAILGAPVRYTDGALAELLSPRHFVEVRRTLGGPAPSETGRALDESRRILASDRQWMAGTRAALAAAAARLQARTAGLRS
jgi:argininosuccinate lyase